MLRRLLARNTLSSLCPTLAQHDFKPIRLGSNGIRPVSGFCSPSGVIEAWTGYGVGIEQAVTLPASWYTHLACLQLEKQHVFYNSWQMVGDARRLQQPGDFMCGSLCDVRYLVVRGQDGQLRAFHNVCRHHAAAVAEGCGNQRQFQCPYHGWTYDDRGRLVKATRLKGIKDFKASQFGLHPIALDTWGHFVFIHLQGGRPPAAPGAAQEGAAAAGAGGPTAAAAHSSTLPSVTEWLGVGGQRLHDVGMSDSQLVHVGQREYTLNCNWKVFCDNYLDGGYHVPYAHKDLASGLDLSGYSNELHDLLSIQHCRVKGNDSGERSDSSSNNGDEAAVAAAGGEGDHPLDRLAGGRDAAYAFVYPNLMINRYGPWMDTNVVLPLNGSSVDRCRVIFDYWLEAAAIKRAAATVVGGSSTTTNSTSSSSSSVQAAGDNATVCSPAEVDAARRSAFVAESLASSHQVQVEDIGLCEAVQLGLQQPAYGVGRYAPGPEAPMYHFHSLLYSQLAGS